MMKVTVVNLLVALFFFSTVSSTSPIPDDDPSTEKCSFQHNTWDLGRNPRIKYKQAAYKNRLYTFVTKPRLTWADALAACRTNCSALANADTEDQYEFLRNFVFKIPHRALDQFWLGGIRRNGKQFQWIYNQKPVKPFFWNASEPTDSNDGDCTGLITHDKGDDFTPIDGECTMPSYFICKSIIKLTEPTPPLTTEAATTAPAQTSAEVTASQPPQPIVTAAPQPQPTSEATPSQPPQPIETAAPQSTSEAPASQPPQPRIGDARGVQPTPEAAPSQPPQPIITAAPEPLPTASAKTAKAQLPADVMTVPPPSITTTAAPLPPTAGPVTVLPPRPTAGGPGFDCSNKECGRYADKNDCGGFYICGGDKCGVHRHCPSGLAFNQATEFCDLPEFVNCGNRPPPFSCEDRPCGSYADERNCASYYVCTEGRKVPHYRTCPHGLLYHKEAALCDRPEYVTCGARA